MVWKKLVPALFAALLLVGALFMGGCETKYTQEEVAAMVNQEKNALQATFNTEKGALQGQIDALQTELGERPTVEDIDSLNKDIEELQKQLEEKETELLEEEEEELLVEQGYELDDLELGAYVPTETLSDRDIEKLFDGELDFDGDEYEAEEVLVLDGLMVDTNKEDYEANAYLTFPVEGLTYKFVVETGLDISEIDEDEPLEFNLLGQPVKVTEWTVDSVTFTKGVEVLFEEGETKEVDGNTIFVKIIGQDYVYVVVNDALTGEMIETGDTEEVEGIEIEATEVLYTEKTTSYATLTIGEEVLEEVENGDEFKKDSIWEWAISDREIGLTLVEEFAYIDEDEDYQALAAGEQLCLPYDYVCVRYDGVVEESVEEYKFDHTMKNGEQYVRIRGNVLSGIEDYEKVYMNDLGFFDKDFELIGPLSVELGDTGLTLDLIGTDVQMDDIEFNLDLDALAVAGEDVSGEEDDYLTNYGIVVKNPEDAVDDNTFEFVVPEEKLEAVITVY